MNSLANSLDVMGIKTWKFHDYSLKGEEDAHDTTAYNILWAPIWWSTDHMGPYLHENTPYSYAEDKDHFALVIGPNGRLCNEWSDSIRM